MPNDLAFLIGLVLIALAAFVVVRAIVFRLTLHRGGFVREIKPDGILARLSKPVTYEWDDTYYLSAGQCPDCHASDSILAGPSGGMAQNVACEWCLSEFNIGHFPDGPRVIERMGKLSAGRARVYGISPEEHERAALARDQSELDL